MSDDVVYQHVAEKVAGTSASKGKPSQLGEALLTQDVIDKSTPITPINVEAHPERIIQRSDGTMHHDWVLTFKRAHVEAMRQGYACLRCWEWQNEPFPKVCRRDFCGYEMSDQQAEDFAREFAGDHWVGPRMNLEEERDRLTEEWLPKDKLEKGERVPGILVPGWAKT